MYPAGYFVRDIPVQASVIVPTGWKVATALRPSGQPASRVDYPVTSYEILMDSPLIAGAHYRRIPLSPDVTLDVIADNEAELAAKPEQIEAHKRLVQQAVKAFGAQHYDHYDFLLTISDYLGGEGLEHHRSSEDGSDRGYFTDWDNQLRDRNLLPHEYSHSWNGKYPPRRRPVDAGLSDADAGQPAVGLRGPDPILGLRARRPFRACCRSRTRSTRSPRPRRPKRWHARPHWRPLVDTTNDPIIAQRSPQPGAAGSAARIITAKAS